MPAPKYTRDQIETAARMREEGKTVGQIALKLGMSQQAVDWHCLREGADSPKTRKNIVGDIGPMVVHRGGHVVRRITAEEDQKLLELEAQGMTKSQIGRALGRRPNSITARLLTLARRDARLEALAE